MGEISHFHFPFSFLENERGRLKVTITTEGFIGPKLIPATDYDPQSSPQKSPEIHIECNSIIIKTYVKLDIFLLTYGWVIYDRLKN